MIETNCWHFSSLLFVFRRRQLETVCSLFAFNGMPQTDRMPLPYLHHSCTHWSSPWIHVTFVGWGFNSLSISLQSERPKGALLESVINQLARWKIRSQYSIVFNLHDGQSSRRHMSIGSVEVNRSLAWKVFYVRHVYVTPWSTVSVSTRSEQYVHV